MECYFCEREACGVCKDCGRASCKQHARVETHYRYLMVGLSYDFICNECRTGKVSPELVQRRMSHQEQKLVH